jgi:hypothetical protein
MESPDVSEVPTDFTCVLHLAHRRFTTDEERGRVLGTVAVMVHDDARCRHKEKHHQTIVSPNLARLRRLGV